MTDISPVLKLTAVVAEYRVQNMTASSLCWESESMDNGVHLVLPWYGFQELRILLEWDDVALDLAGHSSLSRAIILSKEHQTGMRDIKESTMIVLKSHGEHYERVRFFSIKHDYSPGP
jgi:hypothetical protein